MGVEAKAESPRTHANLTPCLVFFFFLAITKAARAHNIDPSDVV